ncbi:TetR/AcrR family transcriptional regulator [Naasia lichenicola]|uniref:TetR/AcrR family transcriptional regulator n=1 Tax=Naasia lichenicola TaxID=2565933 RepID=UPI001E3752BD|nr:TetR/AcrR family transcriptional regulator [Naasia lichenicola]
MVNTSAEELRRIALQHFARIGFAGASLNAIAEEAGLSKSSVLYHYSSKEALLAAAVEPAVDRLAEVIEGFTRTGRGAMDDEFVQRFVDLLLSHRLEVHVFINQGQSLADIPAIQRANALIQRLGDAVTDHIPTVRDRIRFGVALGGAAYVLVAAAQWSSEPLDDLDETRAALVDTITTLLADLPVSSAATA